MNKPIFFTAGPSQLHPIIPDAVQKALDTQIGSISHRSAPFQELFSETRNMLKTLLQIPQEYEIFLLSSATEAWERVVENTVERETFHLVNGAFSQKFAEAAEHMGKTVQTHKAPDGKGFSASDIEVPKTAELIGIVQNESATGVAVEPDLIHSLKRTFPEKLIAVDIVSSAPYAKLDYSHIDMAFFSVQKGFGVPAGIAFLVVSPLAIDKAKHLAENRKAPVNYHNFQALQKYSAKNQTPETPNVFHLFLMHEVLQAMLKKGIQTIRKETDEKADKLYSFFEHSKIYQPFVREAKDRSPTVIMIKTADPAEIIKTAKEHGFMLSTGYGPYKKDHIRIANFPSHESDQVDKLIKILHNYEHETAHKKTSES